MNIYLESIIYFVVSFILIFLFHLYMYRQVKRKKTVRENIIGLNIIIKRHKLNIDVVGYKKVFMIVNIINSFIVAFTAVIIINIESFIYKLLVGFVLIMALIYSLYEIAGWMLKKREGLILEGKIKKKVKKKRVNKNKKKGGKNV